MKLNREIEDRINRFRDMLAAQFHGRELTRSQLGNFAMIQLFNSSSWPSCMTNMRDRATNRDLRGALNENVRDEVGIGVGISTSHFTLCRRLVDSMGLDAMTEFDKGLEGDKQALHLLSDTMMLREEEICGWMLATELLTPERFRLIRPHYERLGGVDMTYFNEHIVVDVEDHARRIGIAVDSLLQENPDNLRGILHGIDVGGNRALAFLEAS